MLKRFEVSGFRNFADGLVLDLSDTSDYRFNTNAVSGECVKSGLVYGRNAVGKSNLGRAIMDIVENVGKQNDLNDRRNYLSADGSAAAAHFKYVFIFPAGEVEYHYSKSAPETLVRESLLLDGKLVFDYDHEADAMIDHDLSLIGAESLNWRFSSSSNSALEYICNNTSVDSLGVLSDLYDFIGCMWRVSDRYLNDSSYVNAMVAWLIENDRIDALSAFLSEFGIAERLTVRKTPSGERVLYFVHSRLVPFVENCSSGTVSLLRLFYMLESPEGTSLLFIDEFDAFYHHDLAQKVIEFIRDELPFQVLCATHNTDLFSNKALRPDCLFVLCPSGIKPASRATERELREGHNLEKLYKAGEFDE